MNGRKPIHPMLPAKPHTGLRAYRHLALAAIWLQLLFFMPGCSSGNADALSPAEKKWLQAHGDQIRLVEFDRLPPIEFVDQDGQWVGYTADVIHLLEARLGITFKRIRSSNIPRIIQQFRYNEADLKGSFPKTGDRSAYMFFTDPYLTVPHAIIVRKDQKGLVSLDDLEGRIIGVVDEYFIHSYLKANYPYLNFVTVSNDLVGLQKLAFNQFDAMVSNLATASYLIEKEGFTNLRIAGRINEPSRFSFATNKKSPILHQIIRKGLGMISSDEKRVLYKKWIGQEWFYFLYNKKLWYITTGISILVLATVVCVLGWNRVLQRQVNQKTIALQRELTERQKLERQMLSAQKLEAIGTFAGGIAHDFNNTLGTIIGYCEMLEMFSVEDGSDQSNYIKQILRASYRAKEMVQQILTFSNPGEKEKGPILVAPIVEEVMEFLTASLPSNIRVTKTCSDSDLVVVANATQVHRILMNCSVNAAQAMKTTGGELEITVASTMALPSKSLRLAALAGDGYVVFGIRDTGTGMDPETIERIFDPFFTTKGPDEGTGMGLSVVHGIVKDLAGAIHVDSEPGKGSCLHIYIPRYTGDYAASEAGAALDDFAGQGEILFVDDHEPLCDFAQKSLSRLGYNVTTFTSSSQAIQAFWRDPDRFDLVITDYTMPELNGLELAEEILAMRPDLPVVMCSGYLSSLSAKEIERAGIRQLLKKPLGAYGLIRCVRRELENRHTTRNENVESADHR